MEDQELRDRMMFSDYLSERDRQDGGHASGNGPFPLRGDMTSEEYIIKLLQTIETLNNTVRDLQGMIAVLRQQLERLEKDKQEDELERKRLWRLIEAK